MQHDGVHLSYFKLQLFQEIYRPGTAISDASNLCTAVGGDQDKEFMGNASFLMEKGTRGGIRIYIFIVFSIMPRKPKVISIRSSLIINLFFVGLQYHIRAVVLSLQLLWGHWVCLHSSHYTFYNTQFAYIWIGRSCIQFLELFDLAKFKVWNVYEDEWSQR